MNELTTLGNRGFGRVPPQAQITKLLIYETGEYNQQWNRPYETNYDGHVLSQFQEQLHGVKHYSPASFSGIAQSFLKPSANVDPHNGRIDIPEGWGSRRCRFMMVVEYDSSIGVRMQEILTGYTTHVGAMPQSGYTSMEAQPLLVDNDMQFFVNSTIHVQISKKYGPNGMREEAGIAKNMHVLADNNFTSMYQPNHMERMRPTDLFAVMSRSHLHRVRDEHGNIPGVGPTLFDGRNSNSTMAALSRRGNVIPAAYMARVVENWSNAGATTSDPGTEGGDFFVNARQYSNDGLVSQDEVLRMIADLKGEPIGNTFKFRDLVRLDPTIQGRALGRCSGRTQRISDLHGAGQTNQWDGRDPVTLAATIISQCVPGIMSDLALTVMHFKMHNEMAISGNYSAVNPETFLGRVGYQPDMAILNVAGFGDQDLSPAMYAFEKRFWFEVMKDLCFDNQVRFMLEVICDLTGETVVNISIDGRPIEQFVTPSFADALLTPLVTRDHNHVVQVADDFTNFLHAVAPADTHDTTSRTLFDGNAF